MNPTNREPPEGFRITWREVGQALCIGTIGIMLWLAACLLFEPVDAPVLPEQSVGGGP